MTTTSVIVVRQAQGRGLDPQAVANATGRVEAATTAPRLTSAGMTEIGWAIDGISAAEFAELVGELRGIFGDQATVTAVIASPAAQATASDELQHQHQHGGIAE